MRSLKVMGVILLFAAAAWTAGIPAAAPRPAAAKPVAAKTASQPIKSDAEIERAIRAKFAKSKIGVEKYQVHVQGGIATIEGKTDVVQHKGVATRLAKSGGAVAVANHIQISDAAREKAAANLESGRRRAQIKRGEERTEAKTAR
jgi:hypothetical protein